MSRLIKSAAILATVAVLLAGCSKSSSNNGTGAEAPKLTAPTFAGPSMTSSGASTNVIVDSLNHIATLFNATAASYTQMFQGAGTPKVSGSTWTWSVSESGGATILLTASRSDTTYQWKAVFNGSYQGIKYDNWTAFTGTETASGANGDWTTFNPNTTIRLAQVSWSTNASGTLTGTITTYDANDSLAGKFVFTNNKDMSGTFAEYTTGKTPVLKVTWTGSGSGQWWEYDDQGKQIATGSWS